MTRRKKVQNKGVEWAFKIQPYNIEDIVGSLNKEEFYSFPKLLHGFWDVLHKYTKSRDFKSLRKELAEHPYKRLECHGPLLDMMRRPLPHVKWGVGAVGNHMYNPHPKTVRMMNVIFNQSHVLYDGTVWKRAIIENNIKGFLEAIRKYKVVIIGKENLRAVDIGIPYDFVEVKHMTIEEKGEYTDSVPMTREELWEIWHEYHDKQKGEGIVYLTQLAYIGCWVMGQTEFKNAFSFDMGIALNYWMPPAQRPKHPWLKLVKD